MEDKSVERVGQFYKFSNSFGLRSSPIRLVLRLCPGLQSLFSRTVNQVSGWLGMKIKTQIALTAALLITGSAALADDYTVKEKYHEEELPFGYVRSMDAFNGASHPTAGSMLMVAEMENKYGHHDKAIMICQQALQLDPMDADLHLCYAEALEKKLKKQQVKDPNLFMTAVREWLIIMRGEVGEEAGLSDQDGHHIPFATHLFQDEDRAMPAAVHLKSLVGYLPKGMEPDSKYLHRVYMSTNAAVRGKILKKTQEPDGAKEASKESTKKADQL